MVLKKIAISIVFLLGASLLFNGRVCRAAPMVGTQATPVGSICITLTGEGVSPFWNPAALSFSADSVDISIIGAIPSLFEFPSGLVALLNGSTNPEDSHALNIRSSEGVNVGVTYSGYSFSLTAFGGTIGGGTSAALIATLGASHCFANLPLGWRSLSVGGNLHLFRGAYLEATADEAIMTLDTTSGYGFALDAGILLQASDQIRLGLVLRNLAYDMTGTRTYRVTDAETGEIMAESSVPYSFTWDDPRSTLLFPSHYYGLAAFELPERITVDLGLAVSPGGDNRNVFTVDVSSLRFGYSTEWSLVRIGAVSLGWRHVGDPFIFRLAAGLFDESGDPEPGLDGGILFVGSHFRVGAAVSLRSWSGMNIESSFGWSW